MTNSPKPHTIWEAVQALVAPPANHNLRFYTRTVRLPRLELGDNAPPIPPKGHKSHMNHLAIIPQQHRNLEHIHVLNDIFLTSMKDFLDDHIETIRPLEDEPAADASGLTMPCYPYYHVAHRSLPRVDSLVRLLRWVTEFPLYTAQSVFAVTFTDATSYALEADDFFPQRDEDSRIYTTLIFKPLRSPTNGGSDCSSPAAISIIVQPPWILSVQDLKAFVGCPTLRRPDESGQDIGYYSAERLWAKVWDTCMRDKTRWFILTSYEGWVLGAFSGERANAFVSPVFEGEGSEPTVAEALVYWLASAAGVMGAWTIPEVSEPIERVNMAVTVADAPATIHKVHYAPSESDWEDQSDAGMSDASDDSLEVLNLLLCPSQEHPIEPVPELNIELVGPLRKQAVANVASWQMGLSYHNTEAGVPNGIPNVQLAPSVLSSAASDSTVRDYSADFTAYHGFWHHTLVAAHRADYR